MSLGVDVGTFSIICAKRNKKEIEFNKGINSFVEIPNHNLVSIILAKLL